MPRALLIASLLLTACGRSPGPNPEEYGQLTYWLLNQATPTATNCTDDPRFDALHIEPPDFYAASWYYIYRVNEGGRTATGYDCTDAQAYDPKSCWPLPERVWQIADHVATLDFEMTSSSLATGCELKPSGRIRLVDEGDQGTARMEVRYELVGDKDTCDAVEAEIRSNSRNGMGLRDCVHGLDEVIIFARTIEPVS